MKIQNFELKRPLGREIGQTAKCYFKAINEIFKEHEVSLSAEQGILMFHINHNEGISQNALADHMMKDKPSITRAVDQLEQMGFVMRVADPRDRRVKLLYMSPQGKKIMPDFLKLAVKLEEDATSGISPEDLTTMLKTLLKIRENLEKLNKNDLVSANNSCE